MRNEIITGVAVAVSGILIVAGLDYNTTDPELELATRRLDQNEKTLSVLSVMSTQQATSIKSLAVDRSFSALKRGMATQAQLVAENNGYKVEDWSMSDQALYAVAQIQIDNATGRLTTD